MNSIQHKDVRTAGSVPSRGTARAPREAPAGAGPQPAFAESLPTSPWIGKYIPIRELGVGAMGVVYLCSQPGLERPVAVKVMIAGRHASPEQILRFQREAWAAAQLSHPNVLQIYDVGCEGTLNYFVMEYVDGPSLDGLIGTPELTLERTLRLVAQVARALQAAHARAIIHRDIKPSNILINQDDQPKLADFGLAKSLHDSQDLSGSGDIIGTPRYMSPEQALAVPGEIDHRTDIYSLGAVMYEMLTGSPPIDGSNPLTILRQLIDEDPVPVRQRNPAVPEEVATICERAIARDKDARYPRRPTWPRTSRRSSSATRTGTGRLIRRSCADHAAGAEPVPGFRAADGPVVATQAARRRVGRRRDAARSSGSPFAIPARSFLGSRRIRTSRPMSPADRRASSGPARVAVAPKPAVEGEPAGRKGKAAPHPIPTARALAMARELLQPGGSRASPGRPGRRTGSSRCSRT